MSTRTYISAVVALMVSAVIFGAGATAVLSIPQLNAYAAYLLPVVIAVAFIVSPFISWRIAPMLRSRWQRAHGPRPYVTH